MYHNTTVRKCLAPILIERATSLSQLNRVSEHKSASHLMLAQILQAEPI